MAVATALATALAPPSHWHGGSWYGGHHGDTPDDRGHRGGRGFFGRGGGGGPGGRGGGRVFGPGDLRLVLLSR